jgi:hypothetical protein
VRRIPARVFKIHKQNAAAMEFPYFHAPRTAERADTVDFLQQCFIQRVGVARNFDAAIDFSGRGGGKIF